MAKKAKDGTEYTNQMSVNKHNMRMDSRKESKSTPETNTPSSDAPSGQAMGESKDGESPDADQHIDAMLDMGMSPDEIHEHAKKRAGMEQEAEPATHSLSTIPGM